MTEERRKLVLWFPPCTHCGSADPPVYGKHLEKYWCRECRLQRHAKYIPEGIKNVLKTTTGDKGIHCSFL
ncbi:hypothetical protein AKJ59_00250 [candidate division MSBL1 archaeon SCGC-AAA385M02]|uniref:Uncharacterized protein n=1 Tax=candidate division MSBL1 archaeon SCGC-AAA385M02 TaxID=1698287 RepID=A0A133VR68_9EURY|nr:hypothetical protein AKJ59_00250 [candidate division MSBL1 archaeon SCGC-AAA385M02]